VTKKNNTFRGYDVDHLSTDYFPGPYSKVEYFLPWTLDFQEINLDLLKNRLKSLVNGFRLWHRFYFERKWLHKANAQDSSFDMTTNI
jgi:hypothetical protein